MTTEESQPGSRPQFSWHKDDIECKLGVRGARYTRVKSFLWLLAAAILATISYIILYSVREDSRIVQMFTDRGWTTKVVVLFSFWSMLMLLIKVSKTSLQSKTLQFRDLVPYEADFVLSPATVDQVLRRLREECDDPTRYILFNRIEMALSNLKNMGQIGDVDEVLKSQASNDEDIMESSYSLIKGLIWAIPVLGFIGTVQGLSSALGNFGGVLDEAQEMDALKDSLKEVTGGLEIAFETTFVALVAALFIHFILTLVRKSEEELLDDCREYCQRYVVGKLRMMPFDR